MSARACARVVAAGERGARVACVCLVAGLLALLAAPARAEDGPRAAVLISAAEGLDPFVSAYAYEVGAGVLRASRFVVAPQGAASARLAARASSRARCADDPQCLMRVACDVAAATLLVVELARAAHDRVAARVTTYAASERGVQRIERAEVRGTETDLARLVRDLATRLAERPAPCVMDVASQAGPARITLGEREAPSRRVVFASPGAHRLRVSVRGREGWEGQLTCRPGQRFRIHVR